MRKREIFLYRYLTVLGEVITEYLIHCAYRAAYFILQNKIRSLIYFICRNYFNTY